MKSSKVCAALLSFIFLMASCANKEAETSQTVSEVNNTKVVVFFPGMGYSHDRPLLSESRAIFEGEGYEIKLIEWNDLPNNKSTDPACNQAAEQLDTMNLDEYEEIIFVSKSIGTVASSTYVAEHDLEVKQIWYTPLTKAFEVCDSDIEEGSIIAFIGTDDNKSNVKEIETKADALGIELHVYDDCDHSLECGDESKDKEVLEDVMAITSDCIKR